MRDCIELWGVGKRGNPFSVLEWRNPQPQLIAVEIAKLRDGLKITDAPIRHLSLQPEFTMVNALRFSRSRHRNGVCLTTKNVATARRDAWMTAAV